MKGGFVRMSEVYEKEYLERADDYENVESNNYLASRYAQMSVSACSAGGLILPVVEPEF